MRVNKILMNMNMNLNLFLLSVLPKLDGPCEFPMENGTVTIPPLSV